MTNAATRTDFLIAATPVAFVLLWSTGFLGAKFGMPHAEPFTFLGYRFVLTAVVWIVIVTLSRAAWPRDPRTWAHAAVVGLLMHGVYLGGVFFAVRHGTSAGISALIVGVQPVLTAILAGVILNERLSVRAWAGLALGFAGITLVVWRQAGDTGGWVGLTACAAALLGITLATLYQKRFAGAIDLRVGSAIQYMAAAVPMIVLATLTETMVVDWVPEAIFAMAWLVLVLSVGAITLLYMLIRRGAASKVASLFYLVPPVVAVEAYFLFGETLTTGAVIGIAMTAIGVAMVTRG